MGGNVSFHEAVTDKKRMAKEAIYIDQVIKEMIPTFQNKVFYLIISDTDFVLRRINEEVAPVFLPITRNAHIHIILSGILSGIVTDVKILLLIEEDSFKQMYGFLAKEKIKQVRGWLSKLGLVTKIDKRKNNSTLSIGIKGNILETYWKPEEWENILGKSPVYYMRNENPADLYKKLPSTELNQQLPSTFDLIKELDKPLFPFGKEKESKEKLENEISKTFWQGFPIRIVQVIPVQKPACFGCVAKIVQAIPVWLGRYAPIAAILVILWLLGYTIEKHFLINRSNLEDSN